MEQIDNEKCRSYHEKSPFDIFPEKAPDAGTHLEYMCDKLRNKRHSKKSEEKSREVCNANNIEACFARIAAKQPSYSVAYHQ